MMEEKSTKSKYVCKDMKKETSETAKSYIHYKHKALLKKKNQRKEVGK